MWNHFIVFKHFIFWRICLITSNWNKSFMELQRLMIELLDDRKIPVQDEGFFFSNKIKIFSRNFDIRDFFLQTFIQTFPQTNFSWYTEQINLWKTKELWTVAGCYCSIIEFKHLNKLFVWLPVLSKLNNRKFLFSNRLHHQIILGYIVLAIWHLHKANYFGGDVDIDLGLEKIFLLQQKTCKRIRRSYDNLFVVYCSYLLILVKLPYFVQRSLRFVDLTKLFFICWDVEKVLFLKEKPTDQRHAIFIERCFLDLVGKLE